MPGKGSQKGLIQFKPGKSGNPKGRPKGARNRSTIAREMLELTNALPAKMFAKLKALYPEITNDMTLEQIMTLAQVTKAISKSDTYAYNSLMDSAYGKPSQPIQHEGDMGVKIEYITTKFIPEKE